MRQFATITVLEDRFSGNLTFILIMNRVKAAFCPSLSVTLIETAPETVQYTLMHSCRRGQYRVSDNSDLRAALT
jgi:hypothetical protein